MPCPTRPPMRVAVLLVLLGSGAAAQTDGPARLVVVVTDDAGVPLVGAAVRLLGGTRGAATDADGRAELALPTAETVVVVSAVGHAEATFTVAPAPGDVLEGAVVLERTVRALAPVETVAARARADLADSGFYDRQARERGTFVTRDDLDARNLLTLREALHGTPGLRIIGWDGQAVAVSGRAVSGADGALRNAKPCPLTLFVDGHEDPRGLVDLATYATSDLAGIEVYVGTAQTPPEYRQFNVCGAILLWTRLE